ncbi:MAG: pyridoxal phosphate-dependent aminotransferase [Acidobacteriota bacterium]|jgi:aspartate/methionine/tyrosine aminotransferase|nr:pyridoxal phosphate-dependent aminotransferase [Acidobacteriota bacterium]
MRKLPPFRLERYFAQWEFKVKMQFSASDCESLSISALLEMARENERENFHNQWLGYTETPGDPHLRRSIAALYPGLESDDILVAAPSELILLALHAALEPGDHALVTWPAYQSLAEVATAAGAAITPWPLRPEDSRWRLDLDFLRDHLQPRTRMVIVNFPHNPTGFIPSEQEWTELLQLADQHGFRLFSDEMYRQLEHEPSRRLTTAATPETRHISLSGLSKAYGLPGLRIGWLACRDREFLQRTAAMKDYTTICSSAPSEGLAGIALAHGEKLLQRNRERVTTHLELLRSKLADFHERVEIIEPDGGPILFPRFVDGTRAGRFAHELIRRHSVLMIPGEIFQMGSEFFRVGLGRADFPAALDRFCELLRESS